MRRSAAVLLAVLALAAVPALGQEPGTIAVSGTGEVEAPPDVATVTAGVETTAPLAQDALAQNAAAMRAVFDAMAAQGIAPADMQTSRFSLDPVWSDREGGTGQPPAITGYTAGNLVTVRVRAVDGVGEVIDALAGAGANRFAGIAFSVADPASMADAALAAAVADARRKADLLAREAGVRLGAVRSVREGSGGMPPVAFRAQADAMEAMPVAAGSVGVTARVEMVFALE